MMEKYVGWIVGNLEDCLTLERMGVKGEMRYRECGSEYGSMDKVNGKWIPSPGAVTHKQKYGKDGIFECCEIYTLGLLRKIKKWNKRYDSFSMVGFVE
jgi:hypothetical protein